MKIYPINNGSKGNNLVKVSDDSKYDEENGFKEVLVNSPQVDNSFNQALDTGYRAKDRMFFTLAVFIPIVFICILLTIGVIIYIRPAADSLKNHDHETHESTILPNGLVGKESTTEDIRPFDMFKINHTMDGDSFRLKFSLKLPEIPDQASSFEDQQPKFPTDPMDDDIWNEIKNNVKTESGLEKDSFEEEDSLPVRSSDGFLHPSRKSSNGFIPVQQQDQLQQPPSFNDFMSFVRKVLHIPKIVIRAK